MVLAGELLGFQLQQDRYPELSRCSHCWDWAAWVYQDDASLRHRVAFSVMVLIGHELFLKRLLLHRARFSASPGIRHDVSDLCRFRTVCRGSKPDCRHDMATTDILLRLY